ANPLVKANWPLRCLRFEVRGYVANLQHHSPPYTTNTFLRQPTGHIVREAHASAKGRRIAVLTGRGANVLPARRALRDGLGSLEELRRRSLHQWPGDLPPTCRTSRSLPPDRLRSPPGGV